MTELTDQMRTCAAQLTTIEISEILRDDQMEAIIHARTLLVEAAALIEGPGEPEMLGEPMEIIKPLPPKRQAKPQLKAPASQQVWTDPGVPDLPDRTDAGCPKCGSRSGITLRRGKNKVLCSCGYCGAQWPYQRGKWI